MYKRQDIQIASKAASKAGIPISVEPYVIPDQSNAPQNLEEIVLACDGYRSFFYACVRYATAKAYPLHCFHSLHFAGMPGGEAFRGTYYRRARILLPSSKAKWDPQFFIRLKYLLDFLPGLSVVDDQDFLETVTFEARQALNEVDRLPVGLRVDHLLRMFQTAVWGLSRRTPFYLPLATASLTKAVYSLDPKFKMGGRLTRAATEILCPPIAWVRTEKGVPTVRKKLSRFHLFLPEKIASTKKVAHGFLRRLLHLGQESSSLSGYHRADLYRSLITFLLKEEPYCSWFSSPECMVTAQFYRPQSLSLIHI